MRITRIGGQPYTDDLLEGLYAQDAQPRGQRSLELTLLFEPDRRAGLILPFQDERTIVTNATAYGRPAPRRWWQPARRAPVETLPLARFVADLSKREPSDVALLRHERVEEGGAILADWNSRQDYTHRLDELAEAFTKFSAHFLIDAQSALRVETRLGLRRTVREATLEITVAAGAARTRYTQAIRASAQS